MFCNDNLFETNSTECNFFPPPRTHPCILLYLRSISFRRFSLNLFLLSRRIRLQFWLTAWLWSRLRVTATWLTATSITTASRAWTRSRSRCWPRIIIWLAANKIAGYYAMAKETWLKNDFSFTYKSTVI